MVIDPTDLGATTVVAPGLMLDNFLPFPNAESLPIYPLELKLVLYVTTLVLKLVVCVTTSVTLDLFNRSGHW